MTKRVFLSYSHRDDELVDKIQRWSESVGLNVFVAKYDISAGDDWFETIRNEIDNCHIFLALVTETYHEQEFTDQEMGMALHAKKPIVCVSVDGADVRGFAKRYQHKQTTYNVRNAADDVLTIIVDAILRQTDQVDRIDFLIDCLGNARTFEMGRNFVMRFDKDVYLSGDQVERLAGAFIRNDQIYHGWVARDRVLDILNRHKRFVGGDNFTAIETILRNNKFDEALSEWLAVRQ